MLLSCLFVSPFLLLVRVANVVWGPDCREPVTLIGAVTGTDTEAKGAAAPACAERSGMEAGGGERDGAKRKREATPDADCCCDICHEVGVRAPLHSRPSRDLPLSWNPVAPVGVRTACSVAAVLVLDGAGKGSVEVSTAVAMGTLVVAGQQGAERSGSRAEAGGGEEG